MSSAFYKKFLAPESKLGSSRQSPQIFLGAFGKHPGWDDHMEDLGLETESLALAKQVLYLDGIGGQIDAGAWDKMDAANRTSGIDHFIFWRRGSQFLLGRLWASTDGKGRSRYPMIVCLHGIGQPVSSLRNLFPHLEKIREQCLSITSASGVQSAMASALAELRQEISLSSAEETTAAQREQFIASSAWGAAREGFYRIIYQIQNHMGGYLAGKNQPRAERESIGSQHVRVPTALSAGQASLADAFLLWNSFFENQLERETPVLFIGRQSDAYLDVVVGEPCSQDFFCLQASPGAIPLAHSIPYQIDAAVQKAGDEALAALRQGKSAVGTEASAEVEGATNWATRFFSKIKKKTWMSLIAAVVLLPALAAVFFSKKDSVAKLAAAPQIAAGAKTPPKKTEAGNPADQYQTSLTQGDAAMAQQSFTEAQTRYKEALQFKTGDLAVMAKLEQVEAKLRALGKIESEFNSALAAGDKVLAEGEFAQAEAAYQKAGLLKKGDPAVGKKLAEVEAKRRGLAEQKKRESQYNALVTAGDADWQKQDYAAAKEQYQKANLLWPQGDAQQKLAKTVEKLQAIAKTDEDFRQAMTAGNQALANKNYSQAKTELQRALALKESDAEVIAALIRVEQGIQENVQLTLAAAKSEVVPEPLAETSPINRAVEPESTSKVMTNSIGMSLVWVSTLPGTKAGGWVGQFEVTKGQFQKVVKTNSVAAGEEQRPMTLVNWNEALQFCEALTKLDQANLNQWAKGAAYALPTGAEWESFLGDAENKPSVDKNSGKFLPEAVGSLGGNSANSFGLFDVLGNVWEWTMDEDADKRVARGGAYDSNLRVRKAGGYRMAFALEDEYRYLGFRCILTARK